MLYISELSIIFKYLHRNLLRFSRLLFLFMCIFARVTKYSCFDTHERKSSRQFPTTTIPPFALETTWNDSFSSRRKPHPSRFSVNRLGFPGIFSSPLFALYAYCSFMFLETNIAHHSAPYFLRRSYFYLLPVPRNSHDLHIRRKVVPRIFASKS